MQTTSVITEDHELAQANPTPSGSLFLASSFVFSASTGTLDDDDVEIDEKAGGRLDEVDAAGVGRASSREMASQGFIESVEPSGGRVEEEG